MNAYRMLAVVSAVIGPMLLSASSEAARSSLSATHLQPIARADGVARVLVDFAGLGDLGDIEVTGAFLCIALPGVVPGEDFDVAAYTVSTDWTRGVATWTSPWERAGGDYDDSFSRSVSLSEAGSGDLRINVTEAVRAMVRGDRGRNGFLLSRPVDREDGFSAADREVLGSLAETRLDVTYVTIPSGRRAGR